MSDIATSTSYIAEGESGLCGESSAYTSKDQQMVWGQPCPLFIEESKTQDIGTDLLALPTSMEIPSGVDHNLNRNSNQPQAIIASNFMRKYSPTIENLKAVVTLDTDQQSSVNKIMCDAMGVGVSKRKAGKGLGHKNDEKPTTKTNSITDYNNGNSESELLPEITENPEEGKCMEALTPVTKSEKQSDFITVIIKEESESKVINDKALNDESHGNDKQVSFCQNNSKLSDQSPRGTNIKCQGCERTFKIQSYYEKHLKEGRCKLICKVCGKEFTGRKVRWSFDIHMRYHNKQRDYKCKMCGKMFIQKGKMVEHFKFHTNPKPKICEKCGKRFPTTTSLNLHMANMHVENRDKFQCSKCANMYLSKAGFMYHMRTAHDSNAFFTCLTCNKTFKDKRKLKVHEVIHKDTRNFKCDQCDSTFKTASGLVNHRKRHVKAYKFFCRTCNKGFYEKRQLHQHENIHSGLKPYACSICEYRCACKYNLPKHMKIHRKNTSKTNSGADNKSDNSESGHVAENPE